MKYIIIISLISISFGAIAQDVGCICVPQKEWDAYKKKRAEGFRKQYGYYPNEGCKLVKGEIYIAIRWRNGYAIKWKKLK